MPVWWKRGLVTERRGILIYSHTGNREWDIFGAGWPLEVTHTEITRTQQLGAVWRSLQHLCWDEIWKTKRACFMGFALHLLEANACLFYYAEKSSRRQGKWSLRCPACSERDSRRRENLFCNFNLVANSGVETGWLEMFFQPQALARQILGLWEKGGWAEGKVICRGRLGGDFRRAQACELYSDRDKTPDQD